MGSPGHEVDRETDEVIHRKRINRTFAIATTETTLEQFLRFRRDHLYPKQRSPKPDGPIIQVNWHQAAQYCRWLSEQEGIPEEQMCFPPLDRIGPGMTLPADYMSRTGYRLPTEAEWEFACRAGAAACRPYGDDPRMLSYYGWFASNSNSSASPVGSLKPNDLGLFDLLGNVNEWCLDWYAPYGPRLGGPFIEDLQTGEPGKDRVTRGGTFISGNSWMRCASRNKAHPPEETYYDLGFRVARTLP